MTCDWSVSFGGTYNRIHFGRVLDVNKANLPENRLSVNVLYYMDLLMLLSFSLSFYHRFEGCTVVRQKRVRLDMEGKAWAIKASKHEIRLPI